MYTILKDFLKKINSNLTVLWNLLLKKDLQRKASEETSCSELPTLVNCRDCGHDTTPQSFQLFSGLELSFGARRVKTRFCSVAFFGRFIKSLNGNPDSQQHVCSASLL